MSKNSSSTLRLIISSAIVSAILIFVLVLVFTGKVSWNNNFPELEKMPPDEDTHNLEVGLPSKKIPIKYELPASVWVGQTFNNCGPATISMMLQQFDISKTQAEVKEKLRTNEDDKNVFPREIVDYFKGEHGLEANLFYNGDIDILKKLISEGFYVITENWMRPNEDIGHVAIVRGYDDERGILIVDDSYLGSGINFKYESFDENQWKPFNREYIIVYTKDQEGVLKNIVGDDWGYSLENSVEKNKWTVNENQFDMNAWFALGKAYFYLGKYQDAKDAFQKARAIGWPARMLWYQIEPIETYNKLGEYQNALELTKEALINNPNYAEAHYQAALAYKGLGDEEKYQQELKLATSLDWRLK